MRSPVQANFSEGSMIISATLGGVTSHQSNGVE
jgi:hypothetical protein